LSLRSWRSLTALHWQEGIARRWHGLEDGHGWSDTITSSTPAQGLCRGRRIRTLSPLRTRRSGTIRFSRSAEQRRRSLQQATLWVISIPNLPIEKRPPAKPTMPRGTSLVRNDWQLLRRSDGLDQAVGSPSRARGSYHRTRGVAVNTTMTMVGRVASWSPKGRACSSGDRLAVTVRRTRVTISCCAPQRGETHLIHLAV